MTAAARVPRRIVLPAPVVVGREDDEYAGKKAFVVNRIGDFGFLIGMFLLLTSFGTLTFSEVASKIAAVPALTGGILTAAALCLFVGATGKSAQLPLYIWLPDAMEGPTRRRW